MKFDANNIEYNFDKGRKNVPAHIRGKQCFTYVGKLADEIGKVYHRKNCALKIFFTPLEGKLEDYYWGTPWRKYPLKRTEEIGRISKLRDATICQNLCWLEGLAPRVYAIVELEKDGKIYPAQLMDYIEGDGAESASDVANKRDIIEKYLNKFGFASCHKNLLGKHDFIDGKLIDFQGFRFTGNATKMVTKYVLETGRYGKHHYQSVPELGITAKPRNTKQRIEDMKLENASFEGKKVLDVGCSLGVFCNYVASRGATRVLGLDVECNVKAARVLSAFLGYWNNDYQTIDLLKDKIREQFDITFFLSMNLHVGFPAWVAKSTQVLIFEENAKKSKFKTNYWKQEFSKWFTNIEKIGVAKDHGNKPLLLCRK